MDATAVMDYRLFRGPVKPEGIANIKGVRMANDCARIKGGTPIVGGTGLINRVRLYIVNMILKMLLTFCVNARAYMSVTPMLTCDWATMDVMVMMVPRIYAAARAATVAQLRKMVTMPRATCGSELPLKSMWRIREAESAIVLLGRMREMGYKCMPGVLDLEPLTRLLGKREGRCRECRSTMGHQLSLWLTGASQQHGRYATGFIV